MFSLEKKNLLKHSLSAYQFLNDIKNHVVYLDIFQHLYVEIHTSFYNIIIYVSDLTTSFSDIFSHIKLKLVIHTRYFLFLFCERVKIPQVKSFFFIDRSNTCQLSYSAKSCLRDFLSLCCEKHFDI